MLDPCFLAFAAPSTFLFLLCLTTSILSEYHSLSPRASIFISKRSALRVCYPLKMPLLALSNELLDKVFEHCDLKSVKCGRLTNGRLREVGNRHLLRELPLYYNQESLDRLDALATTHQDMAKGIQAVWIQIDRLKWMDRETWEVERKEQYDEHSILQDDWAAELKSHRQPAKNPRTGKIPTIDPNSRRSKHAEISSHYLERGYREYNALYTDQRRLDQAGFIREKCAALFRVCPQLSSIWITSGGTVRRCTTQQSASFRQGKFPVRCINMEQC